MIPIFKGIKNYSQRYKQRIGNAYQIENKSNFGSMNINESTDFKKGSKLALENAKKHFAAADSIKDISLGIANSHLILATEETIKADLLDRMAINPNWMDEDFDKFFRNHTHKHKESLKTQFMGLFIGEIFDRIFSTSGKLKNSKLSKEKKETIANKWTSKTSEILSDIEASVNRKLESNKMWWDNANNSKNLGFYVGLIKETGDWIGPFDLTQEQFEESLNIVSKFIDDIESLIVLGVD